MTKSPTGFDPYRKWLGIPSKRRPPTYYDLLALSLDEDDPDVIRSASEQRQSFVQAQRGKAPEKIINSILYQLQEAELTLLDPELRREYDKKIHLFEKRKKRRRVQPNVERSRPESRPGKTVGEGNEIVRTFIGIMLVLVIGFGLMAWYSFQLPWERPLPKTQASQTGRAPATAPQPNANSEDAKDSDASARPLVQKATAPRSKEATTQRNLALYVLRSGGTVYVSPPNVEKEAAESRDEHIKRVDDVPDEDFVVKEISFHGQSQISSFHVKQLVNATHLEKLWLSGTAVNDDAMNSVGQLANLKVLYLGGVAVTDRGMIPIGNLENLRFLGLHATKVTDAGISHLVGLKNLESIRIRDTQITEAAIDRHLPWAVALK